MMHGLSLADQRPTTMINNFEKLRYFNYLIYINEKNNLLISYIFFLISKNVT